MENYFSCAFLTVLRINAACAPVYNAVNGQLVSYSLVIFPRGKLEHMSQFWCVLLDFYSYIDMAVFNIYTVNTEHDIDRGNHILLTVLKNFSFLVFLIL